MVKVVTGDLLESKEQYIAHQCNCVTKSAAGLASYIFKKCPYSNVYYSRQHKSEPGTIQVCGDGINNRYVINMFSQYYPGGAWDDFPNDTYELREEYFKKCLTAISEINNLQSIAMPVKIGCGLAGGNWDKYLNMIENFADNIYKKNRAYVTLYDLNVTPSNTSDSSRNR